MRSIIIKDQLSKQCGICQSGDHWIEEMNVDGVQFLYCHKCNTITFFDEIDESIQHKIENYMNVYYQQVKEKEYSK